MIHMSNELTDLYVAAGVALRSVIKETGSEILNDSKALEAKLSEKKCPEKILYQLLLFINSSNIKNYIPRITSGISMIDINNIISFSQKETGLSKKAIKSILSCIFYGLSVITALESIILPTETSVETKDLSTADFYKFEGKLSLVRKAIDDSDEQKLSAYANDLEAAVRAGHPEALFLKALCYYTGIGSPKDINKAKKFFNIAAKNGHIEANAYLGDIYFEALPKPDFSLAFHHYTVIGAVAHSQTRQERVKTILAQKDANIIDLALSGGLWLAIIVFNILLGAGVFSKPSVMDWVWAGVSMLLCTGCLGLGAFSFIGSKYNSIKWVIPAMTVVALLFAIIALL